MFQGKEVLLRYIFTANNPHRTLQKLLIDGEEQDAFQGYFADQWTGLESTCKAACRADYYCLIKVVHLSVEGVSNTLTSPSKSTFDLNQRHIHFNGLH